MLQYLGAFWGLPGGDGGHGSEVALVNPLFYHQHGSAFICLMYTTGVVCQILFDK